MERGRPPSPLDPDAPPAAAWLAAELRRTRRARGLTQRALARRAGYSDRHISQTELAKAPVSRGFIAALDAALEADGRLLALLPAVVYERAVARDDRALRRRNVGPGNGPMALRCSQQSGEDDDVKRRTFLGLGLASLLPSQDALAGVRAHAAGPDLEEWERVVDAYSHEVATGTAAGLLPALAGDLKELRELLDGALADRDRRRLVRITGQLSVLTAELAVAAGRPQVARQWWRRARQAARASGDTQLLAFACGRQAVLGLYGGSTPTQVLAIAEEGRAATTTPCAGAVSALAGRAQALAVLGRDRPARAALADVAAMFERLPPDVLGERVSAWGWSEQKLRHTESYVYLHLGDTPRGEPARERALALYPAGTWKRPAMVRLHRATSLIADGHVTEGARYATEVLAPLRPEQRSDRLVGAIADRALAAVPERARDLPAVAEVRELLAA